MRSIYGLNVAKNLMHEMLATQESLGIVLDVSLSHKFIVNQ